MSKSIAQETAKMIQEFREEQSERNKREHIEKLGKKEYLDEAWGKVDDEIEYIHKRLSDIWHHPTQHEVTDFHKMWGDLCKAVYDYYKAESKYLPKEEQPVVKADKPGIIKAARPEGEVSVLALHRGDGITEVLDQPTTILSKAIEQVEQTGNYKVMMALVDLDKSKPKEERLYTFTDIESEKLREVIYKKIEEDYE